MLSSRRLMVMLALALHALTGCTTPEGPDVLVIDADQYDAAFDTAVSVARDAGFVAEILDRRGGHIETGPVIASSILEPWTDDASGVEQKLVHTLAVHRRVARFEFEPIAFDENRQRDTDVLTGPDVAFGNRQAVDRTTTTTPLELRVWVHLESLSRPGQRRSTWSRRMASRSYIGREEGGEKPLPRQWWTPVERDLAFERRLLASIERRLDP